MNIPENSIAPASMNPAAPAAPPPLPVDDPAAISARKMRSLGSAAMALAIIDLCGDGYGMVSTLVVGPLMSGEKHLIELAQGPHTADLTALLDQTAHFMNRLMLWNALRLIPYAIASVLLLRIAGALKRGDRAALASARTWSLGAFGVIGFALALQLGVIAPLSRAYQEATFALQRASVPAGMAGFQDTMRSVSGAMSYIGPLLGAMIMAIWPTVLRTASGRLQRN